MVFSILQVPKNYSCMEYFFGILIFSGIDYFCTKQN